MSEKYTITRRDFLASISAATAYSMMSGTVWGNEKEEKVETIQDVIDHLIAAATDSPYEQTVDTVKSGDPKQKVTGVITTFMANCGVIQRAIELRANLIVTHEPTFYNHEDVTDWLEEDAVYQFKRKLLEDHGIVAWRYHDYMHSIEPDPFGPAIAAKLGWTEYAGGEHGNIFTLPKTTVAEVAGIVKQRLGSQRLRMVGNPTMPCQRVHVMVGAPGGRWQIPAMAESGADLLIAGEIAEWETSEYVRDAITAGQQKALLVVGHAATEEPGMEWLASWLQSQLPGIPITHIPGNDPFVLI